MAESSITLWSDSPTEDARRAAHRFPSEPAPGAGSGAPSPTFHARSRARDLRRAAGGTRKEFDPRRRARSRHDR